MTVSSAWPLMIVRQMDSVNWYPEVMEEILDTLARHPGACDEIWFATGLLAPIAAVRAEAERIAPLAEACRRRGMRASFQQGITLGHAPTGVSELSADGADAGFFPAGAWCCGADGRPAPGLLCPTAPEARTYLYEHARTVMEIVKPDSYWLDDDLRLSHKSVVGCFCPRCLELFAQRIGAPVDRETLTAALFGERRERAELCRQWSEFNTESLAGYAGALHRAAEAVLPGCRLGLQSIYASDVYDGPDHRARLMALSGPAGAAVGIRPGAGFYSDERPREMNRKALDVAWEAARCRRYGFVGQVCYEAENYPHISIQKSPAALMTECALMLAAGADALALYWHSPENREPGDSYGEFARRAAEGRPYFARLAAIARATLPCGVARFLGSDRVVRPRYAAADNVFDLRDPAMEALMECGVAVAPPVEPVGVWVVTERSVREMSPEDVDLLAGRAVVIEVATFARLRERFPGWMPGIDIEPPPPECLEVFGEAAAQGVGGVIRGERDDWRIFSRVEHRLRRGGGLFGVGACVCPTGRGGRLALAQSLGRFPTHFRRRALLDALDLLQPGGMALRLETTVAMDVFPRVDSEGKLVAATLLNLGIGETPELVLTVRRPAADGAPEWFRPGRAAMRPRYEKIGDDEWRLTLPSLAAWEIGTLFW